MALWGLSNVLLLIYVTLGSLCWLLSDPRIRAYLRFIAWRLRNPQVLLCPFLPSRRHKLRIIKIERLTRDIKRFTLALPGPSWTLGCRAGSHLKIIAPNPLWRIAKASHRPIQTLRWNGLLGYETGAEIERRYAATTPEETIGVVSLVAKCYLPNAPEFPDGGMMGRHLEGLAEGDTMIISGPWGRVKYLGNGIFDIDGSVVKTDEIGMILGGTGITPGYCIMQKILANPKDRTRVRLLYTSKTVDDILFYHELHKMATENPQQIEITVVVYSAPDQEKAREEFGINEIGPITADMLRKCMPAPQKSPLICIIGPAGLVVGIVQPALRALGYNMSRVVPF